MEYSSVHRLAQEIRQSEEYLTYHNLKESVMADETTAALLKEYKKLQSRVQLVSASGAQPDQDDVQRLQGIMSVLFANPEVSQFLLAEMRLMQTLGDIIRIVTEATGIDMQLPV